MSTNFSIENLQLLINELIRTQPNPELVKSLFQKNKLPCPDDPTEQMAFVLQILEKKTKIALNHLDHKPSAEK